MQSKCEMCSEREWLWQEIEEKNKTIAELEQANEELLREVHRLRSVVRELQEQVGEEC